MERGIETIQSPVEKPQEEKKELSDTFITEKGEIVDKNKDKISFIQERLPEPEAKEILAEYAEVLELAYKTSQNVEKATSEVKGAEIFKDKIFENLKIESQNLLTAAQDIIQNGEAVIYMDGEFRTVKSLANIHNYYQSVKKDLESYIQLPQDFENFKEHGIKILDKYMFDTKSIDQIKSTELSISYIGPDNNKKKLQEIVSQMDKETVKFFSEFKEINGSNLAKLVESYKNNMPDIVIIDEGYTHDRDIDKESQEALGYWAYEIQGLPGTIEEMIKKERKKKNSTDELEKLYKESLDLINKPQYISSRDKQMIKYWGLPTNKVFSPRELEFYIKDFVYTLRNKPDIHFDEATKEAYEKETFIEKREKLDMENINTLELIEQKTADTDQSLSLLRYNLRAGNYHKILDLGTGNGRIAIPLALDGYEMTGIDQVRPNPQIIKKRFENEINTRYKDGKIPIKLQPSDISNNKIVDNYQFIKGNFFKIDESIPDNKKFDSIIFMWHTFCETGTIDNQKDVLIDVYERLNPGGMVYIEIPDRTVGAYKLVLEKNFKNHPEEPVGMSRDSTSLKPGVACVYNKKASPRFFPGRDDLKRLLKGVGFQDIKIDTYLVTSKDKEGNEYLEVKELIITAYKPK